MILAFHSIFSMYGFWLPNDPRGSGSDYIASWELFRFGPATKTNSRRSVAGVPHDVAKRFQALFDPRRDERPILTRFSFFDRVLDDVADGEQLPWLGVNRPPHDSSHESDFRRLKPRFLRG